MGNRSNSRNVPQNKKMASERCVRVINSTKVTHRQPKLTIREPLNYKDLYGNTTDLCKMVENNSVLSIKSTYPVFSGILCHLPASQADSERFR